MGFSFVACRSAHSLPCPDTPPRLIVRAWFHPHDVTTPLHRTPRFPLCLRFFLSGAERPPCWSDGAGQSCLTRHTSLSVYALLLCFAFAYACIVYCVLFTAGASRAQCQCICIFASVSVVLVVSVFTPRTSQLASCCEAVCTYTLTLVPTPDTLTHTTRSICILVAHTYIFLSFLSNVPAAALALCTPDALAQWDPGEPRCRLRGGRSGALWVR